MCAPARCSRWRTSRPITPMTAHGCPANNCAIERGPIPSSRVQSRSQSSSRARLSYVASRHPLCFILRQAVTPSMAQRLRIRTIKERSPFRRDSEVQQYRHGQNRPDAQTAGNVGHVQRRRLRPSAAYSFSGRGRWPAAPVETLAAHCTGHDVLRLWRFRLALSDCPRLHGACARWAIAACDDLQNDDEPVYGPQIISPRTAQQVRSMLEAVVSPEGTAPLAQIPGYRAGGKTGTAYKYTGRGYDKSKYRASFVGIAPMSAPRIIVAISIDEPRAGQHFGSRVAAPVFARIAGDTLRALNIAPDKPIQSARQKLVVSAQRTPGVAP